MTVPAAAAPPAPANRLVRLEVSETLLLEHLLRLPAGTQIAGAEAEHWNGPRLVLHLRVPGAPEGADQVDPQYEKDTTVPDPVRLTGLRWFRAGTEILPQPSA